MPQGITGLFFQPMELALLNERLVFLNAHQLNRITNQVLRKPYQKKIRLGSNATFFQHGALNQGWPLKGLSFMKSNTFFVEYSIGYAIGKGKRITRSE